MRLSATGFLIFRVIAFEPVCFEHPQSRKNSWLAQGLCQHRSFVAVALVMVRSREKA